MLPNKTETKEKRTKRYEYCSQYKYEGLSVAGNKFIMRPASFLDLPSPQTDQYHQTGQFPKEQKKPLDKE